MKNINPTITAVAAATMLLFTSGCGFTTVDEGERGVMIELGKMQEGVIQPGLHFYNPFTSGIVTYTIKQTTQTSSTVPLTQDQQDITIKYSVWVRVPEANVPKLYSRYGGDYYHALVEPQIQEAFREVVAKYKAEDVIHKNQEIKQQALVSVREGLNGLILIPDLIIDDISLPQSLAAAIEQKQVEEQKALQKQYELEKEKRQAEITVARAQAEAKSIQLQGEALRRSPELVNLKWVEKWDGKLPVTMLGDKNSVLYNVK